MGHFQSHAMKNDVAVSVLTLLSLGKPCPVFHIDERHAGEWGFMKKTHNETLSKNRCPGLFSGNSHSEGLAI